MLTVVPTPIGNMDDMTARAIEALRSADVIACEDTRRTIKLLNRFDIKTPMIAYHRHNEKSRSEELVARMRAGENVALVSDAGTPGISDPGETLIARAIEQGVDIDVLPGPNALLPALIISGLSAQPFTFFGFLEGNARERRNRAEAAASITHTTIFYVAPHDLKDDLMIFKETFGDRSAALVREISKVHQEVVRGSICDIINECETRELRGEMVLVIAGADPPEQDGEAWRKRADEMLASGEGAKTIAEAIASEFRVGKNTVKKYLLEEKRRNDQ